MDHPIEDSTVFIDVAEGNAFSGLLDNFAKELQNENIETTSKELDQHKLDACPTEIKTEIDPSVEDSTYTTVEVKPECTKTGSNGSKTGQDRLRCLECQRYTAKTEDQLVRHIRRVHKGENPFQCYMCDYSTYNKVLFEEHVNIHKGIKPYKCSFCSHRAVSKKNVKKHELIHRSDNPLKCGQCDYIGKHKKSLAHHYKGFHQNKEGPTCVVCKKVFSTALQLANHLTVKTKCDHCEFAACSNSLLEKHKLRHEKQKKVKSFTGMFQCAMCEWSYSVHRRSIAKILLHLIHHPQMVDESIIDVSILRKHGIM